MSTKTQNVKLIVDTQYKVSRDSSIDSINKVIEKTKKNIEAFADTDVYDTMNKGLDGMKKRFEKLYDAKDAKEYHREISGIQTIIKEINKLAKSANTGLFSNKQDTKEIKEKTNQLKDYQKELDTATTLAKEYKDAQKDLNTASDIKKMAYSSTTADGKKVMSGNNQIFKRMGIPDSLSKDETVSILEANLQSLSKEVESLHGKKQKEVNAEINTITKLLKMVQGNDSGNLQNSNNEIKQQVIIADLEKKIIKLETEITDLRAKISGVGSHPQVEAQKEIAQSVSEISTEKTKANMDDLTTTNIEYNNAANKSKDATVSFTKSLVNSQIIMSTLKRIFNETIGTIKELDASFNGIAIVSQYTTQQVWSMYSAFEGIAQRSGLTVKDISNVSLDFFRQGRSLSEVLDLTEAAATAAQIAGIDAGESVRYLTSAIQGYNLEASQAMAVSDKFAQLAAASATDYDGLATALSKVASQSYSVGVNMDSMMGFIAKALEVTQEAPENIGTSFKTIFARMAQIKDLGVTTEDGTSINTVDKALQQAGVSLRDMNGEIRDLDDVLIEVGKKWDGLNRNTQTYLTTALAGTRIVSWLVQWAA